jgi:branched-chain amino acid transport system permease protein
MKKKALLILLGLAFALTLPFMMQDEYLLRLAVLSGLFILLASAHNILMKVGQLSLGPVAFYGLGAYVSAILTTRYDFPVLGAFLAAGLVAAAAGWGIGRLTLRLRKAYFVLVTIGFAEFFRLVALNWTDMTNGPMGITAVPPLSPWFSGYLPYYYAILALVILVLFVLWRIENSTIGRAMQAIRENETLGLSVGIDSVHYMMLAAVLSSFIIGLAGSFYAHFFQFVGPELLSFDLTITIVIMVIAGGRATLAGPVLGAVLFTIIPEMLRAATVYRMVIYGAMLVLIMLFMPDGILPTLLRFYQRVRSQWLPRAWSSLRKPAPPARVEIPGAERTVTAVAQSSSLDNIAVSDLPEAKRPLRPVTAVGPELLELKDLCVYFGGLHAVERVSFNVCEGEILAVIGPNGAGKTTLLNAVTRLGPITSGTVTYKGELLNPLSADQVAHRRVVRTFQHTSIFPGVSTRQNLILAHNLLETRSLIDNLARTPRCRDSERACNNRATEVLDMLGLNHHADRIASNLPYGNQRLLELGIALVTNPTLLLLDEPAAGMNATEVEILMDLIMRIRDQGITIVLVEHDMKMVMGISDRIFVLNYGKQITVGRPEDIQQNEEVISAYLGRRKANAST